jgi:peptidoglycan/LPS O-acetylase OafA/YrhL
MHSTQTYEPEPPRRTSPRLVRIVLATALLLLVPLVAMQVTDQVAWTTGDFIAMGTLLASAALAYELAVRKARSAPARFAVGTMVFALLLLVWAVLAVGLD